MKKTLLFVAALAFSFNVRANDCPRPLNIQHNLSEANKAILDSLIVAKNYYQDQSQVKNVLLIDAEAGPAAMGPALGGRMRYKVKATLRIGQVKTTTEPFGKGKPNDNKWEKLLEKAISNLPNCW